MMMVIKDNRLFVMNGYVKYQKTTGSDGDHGDHFAIWTLSINHHDDCGWSRHPWANSSKIKEFYS